MNNKRGGIGGKILLVLVLMLLAAGGGAYGYRVFDGKMAVRDAQKAIKNIDVGDYDTEEATQIQSYLDKAAKDLETAKTRKEVYEVMDEFKEDVSKVQTKTQKELEAARREAEEARKASQNSNNNSYGTPNGNQNYSGDAAVDNGNDAAGADNTYQTDGSTGGGYKSNNLTGGSDETEDSGNGGLLSNLFGNND